MKLLIVDDHTLFRDGLKGLLQARDPSNRVMEAGGLDAALAALGDTLDLDIVLLDLSLPGVEGFGGLEAIQAAAPDIPVAVISATNDIRLARRAVDAGAGGYIVKSEPNDVIARGVESVLAGDIYLSPGLSPGAVPQGAAWGPEVEEQIEDLTPRQREILGHLRHGHSNKEIAHELGLSETTVKVHVTAVLKTLSLDNRTQAALLAEFYGI